MPRPGCPTWNYDSHPLRKPTLQRETANLLSNLLNGTATVENSVLDTRRTHRNFFLDLTLPGFEYYAGSYRGSRECLIGYEVQVLGDPRVGWQSSTVELAMIQFRTMISNIVAGIDMGWTLPNIILPEHEKLKFVVAMSARTFVEFLEIHPYADSNGHMGRVIVWTVLARFGYFPINWPIEPRPLDPPYENLVFEHRNGNPEPLEKHILAQLI